MSFQIVEIEKLPSSSSAAITLVTAMNTSQMALDVNAARKGAYFRNETNHAVYLKCGTTADIASYAYTWRINAGEESPLPFPFVIYTGRIDVIWPSGAIGKLVVTEFT